MATATAALRMPEDLAIRYDRLAKSTGRTKTFYMTEALAAEIDRLEYEYGLLKSDAAKQLMAQADGIQNPRLKESAKRVALTVSAKTRDETITKARNAAFARIPIWAFFLPVTRRQQIVLGRIYSFQCTTNKDGSPAEYRMSLSTGASELGMTNRAEMQKDLQRLISLGFVTKRSNGTRKPATYLVDEVVCVTEARRNGWDG